jgi:hypothetical protein
MTLVVPEGHALVSHAYTLVGDAEPMFNVYGVKVETDTAINAQVMATSLAEKWANFFKLQQDGGWQTKETTVKLKVGPGLLDYDVGIDTTIVAGTLATTNTCPVNTAYLIHKRTAVAGRSGRGRLYLPGVPENLVEDTGVLTAGTATAMTTAAQSWRAAVEAATGVANMVIFHDSNGAAAAQLPPVVLNLVCDLKVSTQRRRLRR